MSTYIIVDAARIIPDLCTVVAFTRDGSIAVFFVAQGISSAVFDLFVFDGVVVILVYVGMIAFFVMSLDSGALKFSHSFLLAGYLFSLPVYSTHSCTSSSAGLSPVIFFFF